MMPCAVNTYGTHVFHLSNSGGINGSNVFTSSYAIRPSVYLKENIRFSSGIGTQDNPYILSFVK